MVPDACSSFIRFETILTCRLVLNLRRQPRAQVHTHTEPRGAFHLHSLTTSGGQASVSRDITFAANANVSVSPFKLSSVLGNLGAPLRDMDDDEDLEEYDNHDNEDECDHDAEAGGSDNGSPIRSATRLEV